MTEVYIGSKIENGSASVTIRGISNELYNVLFKDEHDNIIYNTNITTNMWSSIPVNYLSNHVRIQVYRSHKTELKRKAMSIFIENGYDLIKINEKFDWHLAIKQQFNPRFPQLMETMPGNDFSNIDIRALMHPGCIVDLGCLNWDWSNFFIGKKRVIGVDPQEIHIPIGAELVNAIISDHDGQALFDMSADCGMLAPNSIALMHDHHTPILQLPYNTVTSYSWQTFCEKFDITDISVLKVNVEGAEYTILDSMIPADFARIDQIAISFHNQIQSNDDLCYDQTLQL